MNQLHYLFLLYNLNLYKYKTDSDNILLTIKKIKIDFLLISNNQLLEFKTEEIVVAMFSMLYLRVKILNK
jgi:hypothetical protein